MHCQKVREQNLLMVRFIIWLRSAESIRIFRGNYMRILKVISVPMVETVRFMRLLLRYIWMKQRIHMLSRTYLLSVILIS